LGAPSGLSFKLVRTPERTEPGQAALPIQLSCETDEAQGNTATLSLDFGRHLRVITFPLIDWINNFYHASPAAAF